MFSRAASPLDEQNGNVLNPKFKSHRIELKLITKSFQIDKTNLDL